MIRIIRTLFALLLLALVVACGDKPSSPTGLLDEISGVWRATGDGSMVSIIYAEKKMRMLFGDDSVAVTLGEVDNTNKTVNMNITLINGKLGVWTIRQVWDKEKTTFHLLLTMHEGTQDELSFVRKISTDDLNKIASAEARTRTGSIGSVVKESEVAVPAATTQPQPSTVPVVAPTVAELAPTLPIVPSSTSWSPSFNCTKVSNGAERLICSSRELSEADVRMAVAYRAAVNTSADKDSLKGDQSDWRKNERDACSEVKCMLAAYENRLAKLLN